MGGMLHLVQRGGAWAGCGPAQSSPRCTKCNSPPINGQCTDFILCSVACHYLCTVKCVEAQAAAPAGRLNVTLRCPGAMFVYQLYHACVTKLKIKLNGIIKLN